MEVRGSREFFEAEELATINPLTLTLSPKGARGLNQTDSQARSLCHYLHRPHLHCVHDFRADGNRADDHDRVALL